MPVGSVLVCCLLGLATPVLADAASEQLAQVLGLPHILGWQPAGPLPQGLSERVMAEPSPAARLDRLAGELGCGWQRLDDGTVLLTRLAAPPDRQRHCRELSRAWFRLDEATRNALLAGRLVPLSSFGEGSRVLLPEPLPDHDAETDWVGLTYDADILLGREGDPHSDSVLHSAKTVALLPGVTPDVSPVPPAPEFERAEPAVPDRPAAADGLVQAHPTVTLPAADCTAAALCATLTQATGWDVEADEALAAEQLRLGQTEWSTSDLLEFVSRALQAKLEEHEGTLRFVTREPRTLLALPLDRLPDDLAVWADLLGARLTDEDLVAVDFPFSATELRETAARTVPTLSDEQRERLASRLGDLYASATEASNFRAWLRLTPARLRVRLAPRFCFDRLAMRPDGTCWGVTRRWLDDLGRGPARWLTRHFLVPEETYQQQAQNYLFGSLRSSDEAVRSVALDCLLDLNERRYAPVLHGQLANPSSLQARAAVALQRLGRGRGLAAATDFIERHADPNTAIGGYLRFALGDLGPDQAAAAHEWQLNDDILNDLGRRATSEVWSELAKIPGRGVDDPLSGLGAAGRYLNDQLTLDGLEPYLTGEAGRAALQAFMHGPRPSRFDPSPAEISRLVQLAQNGGPTSATALRALGSYAVRPLAEDICADLPKLDPLRRAAAAGLVLRKLQFSQSQHDVCTVSMHRIRARAYRYKIELDHTYWWPEHLLLGLLDAPESDGCRVLLSVNPDLAQWRAAFRQKLEQEEHAPAVEQRRRDDEQRKGVGFWRTDLGHWYAHRLGPISFAMQELGRQSPGRRARTEHLLTAILNDEVEHDGGPLTDLGLTPERLQTELAAIHRAGSTEQESYWKHPE